MEKISFTIQTDFPATPSQVYSAWLNSKKHTIMTGGKATVQKKIQGSFTTWDGYITGKNIELYENRKIKQTWRTSDFLKNQEDSILEIQLEELSTGITQLTLTHSNLLEKDNSYQQGWIDYYFNPMQIYFSSLHKKAELTK